ncbi:MAG: hypothetical protein HON90_09415 [Halobacteriovoraceae bacterium]|jgi:hypothetical protein|nr:hypothetical protein [Halobacteriovoraceae bacterium]
MELEGRYDYALIGAYVNKTIKAKDIKRVEEIIGSDENLNSYYQKKLAEHQFLLDLIPVKKITPKRLLSLRKETHQITNEMIPDNVFTKVSNLKSFLNKSLLTIKY